MLEIRNPALYACNIAYNGSEEIMASIVVCAEPGSWQQASRFAKKVLGEAELRIYGGERRFNPCSCS